jgi:hypothetical protein
MALDIKAIFGDKDSLTLEEFKAATKDMTLLDNTDGGFVEKSKWERAEKAAKDAKAAKDTAEQALAERNKADESDDSPSKQLEALNKRLDEESKARQDAEARATRKEREAIVAKQVKSSKLQRTLIDDAEKLMADDDSLSFEDAVAKAVDADDDYKPSDDSAGSDSAFRARTGDETKGKPAKDDFKSAIDEAFPEPAGGK